MDNLWFLFEGVTLWAIWLKKNDLGFNNENGLPKIAKSYMECNH
jgi:hypothetical protein